MRSTLEDVNHDEDTVIVWERRDVGSQFGPWTAYSRSHVGRGDDLDIETRIAS